MTQVEEIGPLGPTEFDADVRPRHCPVVIRGAARDWPLVEAAGRSAEAALGYLKSLDTGAQTEVMIAPPSERGRFFYRPDMRGFNFGKDQATLSQLADHLLRIAGDAEPIGIYAGATATATHLPRFDADNPFPLAGLLRAQSRAWLGNAIQVASHFDLSDNFAVVALGRRRFTLFPPAATKDLYVGPLNVTIAGQPVSMVDPLAPDLERYPRFAAARELAQTADLGPGDALFVPSLWWHHVEALEPVNVLINYWHNDVERGGGFPALIHAMLTIRDLPAPQRAAWRNWFDHMVFDEHARAAADHLPLHGQGVNGPATPERDEAIRQFLLKVLSANG
ncbi:MAG TPA: cupin-like domain-containing protein [Croceibacterium sp.]|nr:cupin-like domain-containing protein [Croceibacterium sp.]